MTAQSKIALRAQLLKRKARLEAQLKALDDDEPKGEGEDEEIAAEGDEDEPKGEGDEDEPEAEGDEDEPVAEGDEDEPEAEGDEDEPDAEDEEEETQMRIAAFRSLPEAKGREAQADELARAGVRLKAAKRILRAGARTDRAAARGDTPVRRSGPTGGPLEPSANALRAAIDKVNAKGKRGR